MIKVLWVEDQALKDLTELRSAVYTSNKYSLTISENGTSAINELRKNVYDVIIVDIRIPPGQEPCFSKKYTDSGLNTKIAKIGLLLLERILSKNSPEFINDLLPYAYNPEVYGVFSIESENEIGEDLKELGIRHYYYKNGSVQNDALVKFIDKIYNSNND